MYQIISDPDPEEGFQVLQVILNDLNLFHICTRLPEIDPEEGFQVLQVILNNLNIFHICTRLYQRQIQVLQVIV